MWMSHHFWAQNVTFMDFNDQFKVNFHILYSSTEGYVISILILIAAAAKSAQLPFISWLPRAMEGPTPSSAIFYGSLSVHIGVFILLRTSNFWEHQLGIKIAIGLLGFCTMLIATGISRVQSSIKSQVAYASAAQIGLIFIELALGLNKLALYHFAGNAFLRTYQLLVSPSVVSYLIREQFYHYSPNLKSLEASLPAGLRNTLYILCIKEWNLDGFMYEAIWNPIKRLARKVSFIKPGNVLYIATPAFLLGVTGLFNKELLPWQLQKYMPLFFAFVSLLMVLKSFAERLDLRFTWQLMIMNHFWICLAIGFNEEFEMREMYFYLSGVVISGFTGYWILWKIDRIEPGIDLSEFHGHVYEHPKMALIFLMACLGLCGFPITPTFIGVDLMFAHIQADQVLLAFFLSMSFVVGGLSVIRLYARVFLGPHIKAYHEIAYRSS
jgi:NADH:ubiquinone oxidoreductase subunit 5 (subunit L)/multisubunit Na+/H+ antiporter MnhA subunit